MKPYFYIGGLLFLAFCLFIGNLFWGSVSIPASAVWDICLGNEVEKSSWSYIVLQSRFPQAVTAFFAGAALAVSGLMLQTAFNNPLAGPSILGINSGASLGVALVMLFLGGSLGSLGSFALSGTMAVLAGAFIGAVLILGIIILFSTIVRSNVMLLIVGIMVGYITSSAISLLNFFATAENVFSYTLWGMGDFSGISVERLPFFCIAVTVGKAFECSFVRRKICRKSWGECPSCQDCIVINDRIVDCCGYGILRPGLLYRVGCTPYCQTCFGIFQS